jgi:hypothetical protein
MVAVAWHSGWGGTAVTAQIVITAPMNFVTDVHLQFLYVVITIVSKCCVYDEF